MMALWKCRRCLMAAFEPKQTKSTEDLKILPDALVVIQE